MNFEQVVDQYCAAWSHPDASARQRLLAQVWLPGAIYTDPTVHAAGADALLEHIAKVHARRPGASVRRTSTVNVHHGVGRFAWHVELADGAILPEGIDFAEFFCRLDDDRQDHWILRPACSDPGLNAHPQSCAMDSLRGDRVPVAPGSGRRCRWRALAG